MKPKIVKKAESKLKKEKSQPKRLKTFSSSEFSLWEQKGKLGLASATDLTILKNDTAVRRAQNSSVMTQYSSSKPATAKLAVKKKKKVGGKQKTKVKKIEQQQFEKAKYKQSNSQSEIVFSNDQTKRQSGISIKDVKYAHSINNYEHDSNLVLRVNIKKEYVRKVEAATKIQKVFRGFMTRKILLKYVSDEQEKLKGRLIANSNSSFQEVRQNQTNRTFGDREADSLVSKLFDNRGGDINFNHTIRPRADNYEVPSSSQEGQQVPSSQHKDQNTRRAFGKKQQNWMETQKKEESEQNQQSEEEESNMIYRRQNPIYSQEEISQYLQSSEQQQQEEQDQQLDNYSPEIIFQTNQEYIESRKSSLQNKNQPINKLSNKGLADIALLMGSEDKIRKQLQIHYQEDPKGFEISRDFRSQKSKRKSLDSQLNNNAIKEKDQLTEKSNSNKKKQTNQIKEIQNKKQKQDLIEPFETIEVKDSFTNEKIIENLQTKIQQKSARSQSEVNAKQKIPKSPRRQIKYLDEHDQISNESIASSKKSKSSTEQKQILRLREQQCEKWEEVIRMVNQQIQKNADSNGEMVSFMKNIMQFSQKNKQLLGSTRSVNSQSETFTTPTSMDVYHSVEFKKQSVSVGLPGRDGNEMDDQRNKQESGGKFFKKKKPLKIDIIDSNFLKQERESLIYQKSQSKQKLNKFNFEAGQNLKSKRKSSGNEEENDQEEYTGFYRSKTNVSEGKTKKVEYQQSLEKSKKLKKFLANSIQVQDEAVYDILKLREELLQKRESEQLVKLNKQLNSKQLNQQKFLARLSSMTKKFQQQKQTIDKAKQDIVKGYEAANNLVKQYFYDVRRMGIKLAVSKSQDNLKYKFSQPAYFSSDVKIDELTPQSTPKSSKRPQIKQIFAEHEISEEKNKQKSGTPHHPNIESSQDSSIDFTEQQLKRFRKAANYDLEFNDLNRNMTTISEDFINQQRKCFQDDFDARVTSFYESPENLKEGKAIVPQRQTYLLEEFKVPSSRTPPHVQAIVQNQINTLAWQFASELMLRPEIAQKFVEKPTIIRPSCITNQERVEFLKILQENLPPKHILHAKLNQNITPLPSEILKCMRLDFSDEAEQENDDNYQEINRYQFVISQQACAKSVMTFKNNLDQTQQRKEIQDIKNVNQITKQFQQHMGNTGLAERIARFIVQRDKFIKNKKQHSRELRWEVMNIELHCIFDSWNEEIIQICSVRPGFSGIGLNQLTLSMINHNKPVKETKSQTIVVQAKNKVVQILADDTDINAKILRQNFHEMCETDSAWIFYADEALSYALELVYLVEEDVYSEVAKELRKIIVKNSLAF